MSDIKQIQTKLKSAGFYSGIIDGIWGKNSKIALDAALLSGKLNSQKEPIIAIIPNEIKIPPLLTRPEEVPPLIVIPVEPVKPVQTKGYKFSAQSLSNLNGLNERLVKVIKRALEVSEIDFAVNEGKRTLERQKKLKASGASQTLKSNHLTGNAVDLVPTPNGKMDWNDWNNFYTLCQSMQKAAEELGIAIRWGGCWETINHKPGHPKDWIEDYGKRRRALGKKPFTDGPHYELVL